MIYQLCRYARLSPLDTTPPIRYGDVVYPDDTRISDSTRARLLKSGTLIAIDAPPLAVLPHDWADRAVTLAGYNIITISDLLVANERELARAIGKTPKIIKQWKIEAKQWLNPESQPFND